MPSGAAKYTTTVCPDGTPDDEEAGAGASTGRKTECSLVAIDTYVVRLRSIRLRRIRRADDEAQLAVVDQLVFR